MGLVFFIVLLVFIAHLPELKSLDCEASLLFLSQDWSSRIIRRLFLSFLLRYFWFGKVTRIFHLPVISINCQTVIIFGQVYKVSGLYWILILPDTGYTAKNKFYSNIKI